MNTQTWHHHAITNRVQTVLLLAAMLGFLVLIGWIVWGSTGVIALLTAGITLMLLNPTINPQLILKLYRGEKLPLQQLPDIQNALNQLASRSGLETVPDIYYLPSSVINAFTLGRRNNASIALTDGFFRSLNYREIVGVLAHEISHIKSNDTYVMGLADMFSRLTSTFSLLGQFLLFLNIPLILLGMVSINWLAIILLMFAPIISTLAQLGLSRIREYDADLNAAKLTGDPEGLASALVKIERIQHGWIEQLLLPGRKIPEPSILRTHPPTEERIRRLLELREDELNHASFHDQVKDAFSHNASLPEKTHRRPRWHLSGLWH